MLSEVIGSCRRHGLSIIAPVLNSDPLDPNSFKGLSWNIVTFDCRRARADT